MVVVVVVVIGIIINVGTAKHTFDSGDSKA